MNKLNKLKYQQPGNALDTRDTLWTKQSPHIHGVCIPVEKDIDKNKNKQVDNFKSDKWYEEK